MALPCSRRVVMTTTAVAGVVAGHASAYAVAFPDRGRRAAALHAAGHGYWDTAVIAAVGAAVAALVLAGWRASRRDPVALHVAPVAAAQMGLFAVAEAVERLVAGASLDALLLAPEFLAGLVVQVVVAFAAVVLLRLWARGVEAVVAPARRRVRSAGAVVFASDPPRLSRDPSGSPAQSRAPPRLAPA